MTSKEFCVIHDGPESIPGGPAGPSCHLYCLLVPELSARSFGNSSRSSSVRNVSAISAAVLRVRWVQMSAYCLPAPREPNPRGSPSPLLLNHLGPLCANKRFLRHDAPPYLSHVPVRSSCPPCHTSPAVGVAHPHGPPTSPRPIMRK
jgi:hypothetical protein